LRRVGHAGFDLETGDSVVMNESGRKIYVDKEDLDEYVSRNKSVLSIIICLTIVQVSIMVYP